MPKDKPPLSIVPRKPRPPGPTSTRASKKTKRRRADWEAVERDYRTGKFSLRELETIHGASPAAISRKAAANGWTKDLSTAIKQATQTALLQENGELLHKTADPTQQKAQNTAETPAEAHKSDVLLATVLAAAELNKRVILSHRRSIERLQAVTNKAVDVLERQADELLALATDEKRAENARTPDSTVVLLGAQRASATMAKLQAMERIAYGLDEKEDAASGEVTTNQPKLSDAARAARIAKLFQMAQAQQAAQEGAGQDDDARAA